MIPDRHVLIALLAADSIRIKSNDMDRMRAIGNEAKKPEAVGRGAADFPC